MSALGASCLVQPSKPTRQLSTNEGLAIAAMLLGTRQWR